MNDEVLAKVKKCVGEVLALEPADIASEATIMEELGAESLDLVELMYVLEQEFGIRLEQQDLSLTAQLGLSEDKIHNHEVLTSEALTLLREKFPGARHVLVEGITRKRLGALLTVSEVARAVERKLAKS